jgi:hypothetical protein
MEPEKTMPKQTIPEQAATEEQLSSLSLSPDAQNALEEATKRRSEIDARSAAIRVKPERLGRGGEEPTRYGDWEVKGLTSDF